MTWVAYVDESMRQRADGKGIYVLAAAMLDPADVGHLRESALGLRRHRRRFHWRVEEPADKRKAVATVAGLESLHLVVVGSKLDVRRQERTRRRCLERLLWSLDQAGLSRVWLDSRTPRLNRLDVELVDSLRVRGAISGSIHTDFVPSTSEALLWLPDIVAGAVSAAFGDGDEQYLRALESVVTLDLL